MYDSSANLTYTALTGSKKQSVSDAERLFSDELRTFMRSKKYSEEERYIGVIGDWRKACDERGISELTRSKYNYSLLNYIVEDLMPWHGDFDFSYLEVNRYVSSCTCIVSRVAGGGIQCSISKIVMLGVVWERAISQLGMHVILKIKLITM